MKKRIVFLSVVMAFKLNSGHKQQVRLLKGQRSSVLESGQRPSLQKKEVLQKRDLKIDKAIRIGIAVTCAAVLLYIDPFCCVYPQMRNCPPVVFEDIQE